VIKRPHFAHTFRPGQKLRAAFAGMAALAVATLGMSALVALPATGQASAASTIGVIGHVPSTPRYDIGINSTVGNGAAISPASTTSPKHFSAQVVDGASTFTYEMVGKNPSKAQANGLTTVKTLLVPIVIKFSNGDTWNPTVADSCDSGASALVRTENSPLFVSQPWTWGGKSIGTVQVTDAFQRAEFWKYAKPTGVDPTYGVNLALTTLSPVTINVPNADAATAAAPCGNRLLGAVEINWLDGYLRTTVIPSLASQGVAANTLPIFLLHNVVEYVTTTSNCCALGYHNSYAPSAGVTQTYSVATYDNSTLFTGSSDISAVTHEVAEWQNDPFDNNATKPWGHIGQVTGCQSNLEVGDPLSGTTYTDTVGGFTYHPQELAFFSWFFHQSPSIGVKKTWYSDQGTFTTSAAACT
jgi:hypothetical protein